MDEYFDKRLQLLRLYWRLGWPLFPIKPRSKIPATPHGFKDAGLDHLVWMEWWRPGRYYNIGVPTGMVSGQCVLDIDPRNGGDASLETLKAAHGPIDASWVCDTPSGGWHLYFQAKRPVASRKPWDGIEWKADGGYVLLPPSIHPNGGTYKWAKLPRPGLAADIPAWIGEEPKRDPIKALVLPGKPRKPEKARERYFMAVADRVRAEMLRQGNGSRNVFLNRAAFSLGRLAQYSGGNARWALSALAAAAQHAGLDAIEVDRTVASGYQAGEKHPLEVNFGDRP